MQPYLHDLVTCVHGTACVLGGPDGQIRPGGAEGLHHLDLRSLRELVVTVDGRPPDPVGWHLVDAATADFVAVARGIVTDLADPTIRVERLRRLTGDGLMEKLTVVNDSRHDVELSVVVTASCDFAPLTGVKSGQTPPPVAPEIGSGRARWTVGPQSLSLAALASRGDVSTEQVDHGRALLRWHPRLDSRSEATLTVTVAVADERADGWFHAADSPTWEGFGLASANPALDRAVARSLDDLRGLLLTDGDDVFAAAGTPWFLTLFGRDALWTARFLLPLGTELAAGTLRSLARRQATDRDPTRSAEPGKILHELRLEASDHPGTTGERLVLPAAYYGTVDATPLWVSLLHDAWQWGLDDAEVTPLLDPLEQALGWIAEQLDTHGFLSYHDVTGHGLANQGWKDSGDSIQFADGSIAAPPVTLCEVQAYAYRALLDGAALLDAFERPGGEGQRRRAATLAERFRERFWVDRDGSAYPAVALDGAGRRVDSLTSNIAHLLGTGLLDGGEERLIADTLGDEAMSGGYGLRTLDARHRQFNPLGYHSGSVWPHDTAIAIAGLCRAGFGDVAARIAGALVEAAAHFDGRLPELLGGGARAAGPPLAYPAACRPQAWSAAALVAVATALCGLGVDQPGGDLTARPDPAFVALFPLRIAGLRVGDRRFDLRIDSAGDAAVRPA